MSNRQLVLASTSSYRAALLARLGVPFSAVAPACDENSLKHDSLAPRELAERLAEAKAASLRERFPEAVILGSDQVCACEGVYLSKPGDAATACRDLAFLAGKSHQLFTALAICRGDQWWMHTDVTTLQMRVLTPDEIQRYVAADNPLDCAGSYKLEERGIALFERIASDDHTAITGLPLLAVARLLRQCGFAIP
jgi:septum formation protein